MSGTPNLNHGFNSPPPISHPEAGQRYAIDRDTARELSCVCRPRTATIRGGRGRERQKIPPKIVPYPQECIT